MTFALSHRCLRAACIALALAASVTLPAKAQSVPDPDALPSIAPAFRAAELSAIARLRSRNQTSGGCTAVLVTPSLALTAGHCTSPGAMPQGNPRMVIFAPDQPPPLQQVPASASFPHPQQAVGQTLTTATAGFDISLMRLGARVPDSFATPLPLTTLVPGEVHAVYGYLNGNDGPLHGHDACQVVALSETLFGSDCRVGGGFSGGAFLRMTSEGWALAGILVAQIRGREGAIRSLIAPIDPTLWRELSVSARVVEVP